MSVNAVVHVVDDDSSVRTSLLKLFRAAGYAVQTYGSAAEFLARELDDRGGCVVLDLRMPGLSGLDLQQALVAGGGGLPIIFLSAHGDVPSSVQAMRAGAVDFLVKPARPAKLLAAVRSALERDAQTRQTQAAERELHLRIECLSQRERQVLVLVATGKLNKQIAAELGITLRTVKEHRGRVMQKLGLTSVADLVRLAERSGLMS